MWLRSFGDSMLNSVCSGAFCRRLLDRPGLGQCKGRDAARRGISSAGLRRSMRWLPPCRSSYPDAVPGSSPVRARGGYGLRIVDCGMGTDRMRVVDCGTAMHHRGHRGRRGRRRTGLTRAGGPTILVLGLRLPRCKSRVGAHAECVFPFSAPPRLRDEYRPFGRGAFRETNRMSCNTFARQVLRRGMARMRPFGSGAPIWACVGADSSSPKLLGMTGWGAPVPPQPLRFGGTRLPQDPRGSGA